MIEVNYYNASTNEGGQGLWRKTHEAASHIARIARATPDAVIEIYPEGEREITNREAITILNQADPPLTTDSSGPRPW